MTKQLLIILTAILFISCSNKEDIKKDTNKKDLIGKWNVSKVYSKEGKIKATYNMNNISIPIEGELILEGSDYKMQVSFTENTISSLGSFKINTTIKLIGLPSPQIPPFEVPKIPGTNGTWDVKEEKLINKIGNNETSINIKSYSKDKIVFSYPISEYIDNESIKNINPNIKDVQINGHLLIELTK